MTRNITFSLELLAELQRLHREHRTGWGMITHAQHTIQINLEQGEITYLACSNKRGEEALPLLREVSSGKLIFVNGPTPALRLSLPSTADILNYLGADSPISMPIPAAPATPAIPTILAIPTIRPTSATPATPATSATLASTQPLSAPVRAVLQKNLAEIIGPMALLVCEERLAGISDLETALATLSQMLPNPAQVHRFQEAVRKQLG
jgi:hypothetical protein